MKKVTQVCLRKKKIAKNESDKMINIVMKMVSGDAKNEKKSDVAGTKRIFRLTFDKK